MPDILEYSWSQFLAFLAAAAEVNREQAREGFLLGFIAARGSEKSVKKVIEDFKE